MWTRMTSQAGRVWLLVVTQHLNYIFFGKHHNIMLLRLLGGPWGFDVNSSCPVEFYYSLVGRADQQTTARLFSVGHLTGDP